MSADLKNVERTLSVQLGGFEDMTEALAWTIAEHDENFKGASFVKVHIESYMVSDESEDGKPTIWRPMWQASVTGMLHVPERVIPDVTG